MFLLVPVHPGCPGQIPQSRKTVVCVCVCVVGVDCVFIGWIPFCHPANSIKLIKGTSAEETHSTLCIDCIGMIDC